MSTKAAPPLRREQDEVERCAAYGRALGQAAPPLTAEQRQVVANIVELGDEQDERWSS